MRSPAHLAASIERYRRSFWNRESGLRPPVAVVDEGIFLPIRHLRRPVANPLIEPWDVARDLVMTDYEYDQAHRTVFVDDWIPFAAAWRGIPWLEAWCGCPVRYSTGSLAPHDWVESPEQLAELQLPVRGDWFELLKNETRRLFNQAPADCLISPTILRGASDVLGALRRLDRLFTDLFDAPHAVRKVAQRINQLLLDALDMHFSIVKPRLGGYGHIFGYWAPHPTICIQEDALGMCGPDVYRDLFMEGTARIVRHLGSCILFHLHTTGCAHWRHILGVPGLAGLQFTVESNGPSLLEMVPVFRQVLQHSRLILFVDHGFEQLEPALNLLPHEGLYLLINQRHLPTNEDFRRFVEQRWPGRQ